MGIPDYIQLALLIVTVFTLLAVLREMAIQNRGLNAQALRDRYDMYTQTHAPITDDQLKEVHLIPDDYVEIGGYLKKYKGNNEALRKYMGCFHRYEYLAFCYSLKKLKLPDPLGYSWTETWATDLLEHAEFLEVHNYHKRFYPEFAKFIDESLSRRNSSLSDVVPKVSKDKAMIAKVAVLGTFRFPPEKIAEVLPHLKALVDATYKNDGCIAYDVAEDLYDKGLIRMSELWPDHELLEKHLQAPHIEPWRKAVVELGLIDRDFMVYDITNAKKL